MNDHENLLKQISLDIDKYQTLGLKNKRRSDVAAIILIFMGILSGMLIAIPDEQLKQLDLPVYLRQVIPVLTAAVYAGTRHFRWTEKHMWYWNQRHKLIGLKFRIESGDSSYSQEYSEILQTAEGNYPIPVYRADEKHRKEEEPNK